MKNANSMDHRTFENLDFTGCPTPRRVDEIVVVIHPSQVLGSFAKAFVDEAMRKAPLTFDKVELTIQEVTDYVNFLVSKRIEVVNMQCSDFRKLKTLWIPSYVQYCLRLVGKVDIYKEGLLFVPMMDTTVSIIGVAEAQEISDKISAFRDDLQMHFDAMPRETSGDEDVMSTALIADYVCARKDVHPASTYVSAFMGFKLQQEAAFSVMYRKRYDDISYIAAALASHKVV